MGQGYYRHPALHAENVVFVSEDDLWAVPATGGVARRLTSGLGAASYPAFSRDGRRLAFSGRDEGHTEVYVMPAEGGEPRRVTYLGGQCIVVGWDERDRILFASSAGQPFGSLYFMYAVSPEGGQPERLPVGLALFLSKGPGGGVVLGRNALDAARWKRYRGGTAGVLWVDPTGGGHFRKLLSLKGNPTRPLWIGARIYFASDHEGVGNLYSCLPTGKGLRRHTHHEDFYARNPSSDGKRIVYHAGADLYLFDPATGRGGKIAIEYPSPRTQRARKFADPARYLQSFEPHPQGHLLALSARGKAFVMGNWEGAAVQFGEPDGVRYRAPSWLDDGKRLVAVSDAEGEERLELHPADGSAPPKRLRAAFGRCVSLRVSPKSDAVVLANHRNELIHVDLASGKARVLDRSAHAPIGGFDWSPDGRWIAYGFGLTQHTSQIRLCEVAGGKIHPVTRPVLQDVSPSFDPEGKYLYFLSYREFDPVYDSLHFDLGFPKGVRPYLAVLKKDQPSPFVPVPKPAEEKPAENKERDAGKKDEKKKENARLEIDLEGLEDRVLAFPVPEGRYLQIAGIKGKVLYTSIPVEGSLNQTWVPGEPQGKAALEAWDLENRKAETLASGVSHFTLSHNRKALVYRSGNRLRVLKPGEKNDDAAAKEGPGRKSGWIDLQRIKLSIRPPAEWRQMYAEAWRLQRDHFWTEDLSQVDWKNVYRRYLPLLDRVSTRGEFSDLAWEMQGELGTSHAYEIGGDYRSEPHFGMGFLGADLAWEAKSKRWRVARIVRGDAWDEKRSSPLTRPGVNVREGDTLLAIGGRPLSGAVPPQQWLVHQAETEVLLTVADAKGKHPRQVTVKTLAGEGALRYREWVEANRARVHAQTGGRAGYVHIPNMGPWGYAEFHRYFLAEIDREGLVVDVRFNGGGHVSQLILEKLARKRIAYCQTRWFGAYPYPEDSVAGPMVALTNEFAGSDGDIFSHGFKLLKLGPLIGKRTWGGVIGISPRHPLVDGSVTTQPEFSFWFKDVGWEVENYGTDPDIEVEYRPQDYAAGRDPQLERGLAEIKKLLRRSPPFKPDLGGRPSLALPKLPKGK